MKQFALGAIADSTRRTYDSAIRRYRDFCASKSPPWPSGALSLTTAAIAEFIAQIGVEGKVTSRTLDVYLSGLSTWWMEALPATASPFNNDSLLRIRDGVRRRLDALTLVRKAQADARPEPIALTAALLLQLEPALRADAGPRSRMILAAANLGVHTVLRPGEMLGSKQHLQRAPLEVTFFRHKHSGVIMPVAGGTSSHIPDHFSIDLGATKTDQAGRNPPKVCAVPSAVRAIWEWAIQRLSRAETSPLLFALDGVPLLMPELLSELESIHKLQGLGSVRFTGKCFRRGGNSSAAAAGLPLSDLQARGGWASSAMVDVYTTAEAKRERILALGRSVPSRLQ